jgi:aryl-alcohol dehydrogenase-like predicted oxidoreductase
MELRRLGLAGVRVSSIGVGCNQFGGGVDERGTAAIVRTALDLGINFFDTAESYSDGRSEEYLGKALGDNRREVVLATKTGLFSEPPGKLSRRQIISRLDGSLRRLGTDYVDLFYLHFPDAATPLEESLRALDDMVQAGKVLYPAISNHPAWQVTEALAISDHRGFVPPVVSQNQYSLIKRDPESELIPACAHFGMGLVPYYPLAEGFLTGKYRRGGPIPEGVRGAANEDFRRIWLRDENFDALERYEAFARESGRTVAELAVAWLLANPVVCSVITGVTTPTQLAANVLAAEWMLTTEQLLSLDQTT